MTLDDAYHFVSTNERPKIQEYHNEQVMGEIDYFMKRYSLIPMVYIAYDRKAMCRGNLRITFDTNIRTRRYDLALELGDHGDALLDEGMWLMEIKIDKAFPMWLSEMLTELKIYSCSFSKYGNEFLNYLTDTSNEEDYQIYEWKGVLTPCSNQSSQAKPQVVQFL